MWEGNGWCRRVWRPCAIVTLSRMPETGLRGWSYFAPVLLLVPARRQWRPHEFALLLSLPPLSHPNTPQSPPAVAAVFQWFLSVLKSAVYKVCSTWNCIVTTVTHSSASVPQRGLYIVLNMKLLWPPAPLSVSTSPTTATAAAAVAALTMETAPIHRQRQTNSLLNLCLSLYTAGCVRKAGHTNKRRANKKNELALVSKDFDLDQVRLLPPTNSLPRSLTRSLSRNNYIIAPLHCGLLAAPSWRPLTKSICFHTTLSH